MSDANNKPAHQKLDYYNLTSKGLSYSRRLTLQACPRKFQLDADFSLRARRNSVTFAYGHAVGMAVQSTLEGKSFNRTLLDTIMAYDFDADDMGTENEQKSKKNIWWAIKAAELIYNRYHAGMMDYLNGWEIAKFVHPVTGETLPAVELTFVVELVDGYTYEGHIDLILYHPNNKRFMIVELKTTGMSRVADASYKNSDQALGYGVILDLMVQGSDSSASYDVLYLIYKSKSQDLVPMVFTKTVQDRVNWIRGLLHDVSTIQNCKEQDYFPRQGQSCYNFFRECEYFHTCNMSDAALRRLSQDDGGAYDTLEKADVVFFMTLEQLLERQDNLITAGEQDESDVDLLLDITQID